MNIFTARYTDGKGITRSVHFDKARFDQQRAEDILNHNGIKNFFFFFEPIAPTQLSDNTFLFSGEIGFDITFDTLLPYLNAGNEIVLDSFGGSAWEGLKIYDGIKALGLTPKIGVLGSLASAATLIPLATSQDNRWMSPNSRFLIHNPWTVEMGDDAVMSRTAEELRATKMQLAKIYATETGTPIDSVLALMAEERFLDFDETKAFNFISNSNIISQTQKDDDMNNEEVVQKLSALETMMNKVMNLFNGKNKGPKNIIVQDVNGTEIDFGESAETEDQIVVGTTATIGGTPAEGEYTMSDGRVFVFIGGTLTEIKEAQPDETAVLREQNDQLNAELATVKAQMAALTTERDGFKAQLASAQNEFNATKAEFDAFKASFNDFKPTQNTPPAPTEGNKPKFSFKKK